MNKFDPRDFSTPDLLNCYANILDELKERKVIRTFNSPTGDYAEWLVRNQMNLSLEISSKSGYDAIDSNNVRYQIKSRRLTSSKTSRQLNVIRNLNQKEFDYLIGILFDRDFRVREAYKIPHDIIDKYAKFSKHQNGHILYLRSNLLKDLKVEDITNILTNKHI